MVLSPDASRIYLDVLSGMCGLVLGSFLNVVAYRVPRKLRFVWDRSSCPSCGTNLAARDNIPILSFVMLRGRCRHCGTPIPIRYPFIEALAGLELVVLAVKIGPRPSLGLYAFLAMAIVSMVALESTNPSSIRLRTGALIVTVSIGASWLGWESLSNLLVTVSIATGLVVVLLVAARSSHLFQEWWSWVKVHLVALSALVVFIGSALSVK